MIDCGVCGKGFNTNEEYKNHVEQAHEAMNDTYSEAFCKANEETTAWDLQVCRKCGNSRVLQEDTGYCAQCSKKLESREVNWRDIGDKKVIDKGSHYETEDGTLVDWSSYDATDAQKYLSKKVNESKANEDDMDDLQYKQQFGYDWRDDKAKSKKKEKEGDEGGARGLSSQEQPLKKVDSLSESWGVLEKEKKAQLFESLGINQGSAYTLANLDWYNLSPQLKKDASEAYAKEEDLVIDNDEDLYALHKGIMDKPVKDDEEKEINEAYRDFYDIEKYHDSPDYKKKANEQGLDDECPFCKEKIKEPETLDWHMEQEHGVHIPSQYTQTGIQGAMADTDFDSLGSDFYSEANPNHADDGKFSSVGGSSSLNDSHKQALDKYIEKHGKEDYNVIGSLGGWDENVHLPANILKQVKGANHDEMLDYIRSKVGNEAKDRPVVEGDPVHVVSQQCFDWEGYEIDCESGERIGKGYSQSKAYQQFLNEAYDEWTCSKCGVKLPYGKSVGDHLLDHGITFEAKEEFDYNWACPRCGNKKVTTKKDEYGNPIGRSCPKCGLGNEAKAEESDYSSLSTEELQRRLQR